MESERKSEITNNTKVLDLSKHKTIQFYSNFTAITYFCPIGLISDSYLNPPSHIQLKLCERNFSVFEHFCVYMVSP